MLCNDVKSLISSTIGTFLGAAVLLSADARRGDAQAFPRDFSVPTPRYAANSAWNQIATSAAVLPESEQQILTLYRVLLGDGTSLHPPSLALRNPFPFGYVNYDAFSQPVFRMGAGKQQVLLRDYSGNRTGANPKLSLAPDGTVTTPAPAGTVRPAGPESLDADGHVVLYNPDTFVEYDFWQATTASDPQGKSLGGGRAGTTILEAGAIDFFHVCGAGANPPSYTSARATGVPLLGGMVLPEDIERGSIDHALAFAIPGPRNTNPADPSSPRASDYFYPASTTEANFFNTNPLALAAGQRIRLKPTVVDESGTPIDESTLKPITRMFLQALRTYGAYLVDNSGSFAFPAEDIHTAVLRLSDDQVNALAGRPSGTPIPPDKTRWQVIIEALNADLEKIPVSSGPWSEYGPGRRDPATAPLGVSNFQVVTPATGATWQCVATPTSLCLGNGRFKVQVAWRVPSQGTSGGGTAAGLTSDTGYFWFFSSNNIELMIKVVDGRAFNNKFWVFYGALSNVEYTITVTDTTTGIVKTYLNPSGTLASVADTSAF